MFLTNGVHIDCILWKVTMKNLCLIFAMASMLCITTGIIIDFVITLRKNNSKKACYIAHGLCIIGLIFQFISLLIKLENGYYDIILLNSMLLLPFFK